MGIYQMNSCYGQLNWVLLENPRKLLFQLRVKAARSIYLWHTKDCSGVTRSLVLLAGLGHGWNTPLALGKSPCVQS